MMRSGVNAFSNRQFNAMRNSICHINFSTAWGFIESKARVVWVKVNKPLEVGIAFLDMTDEAQTILVRQLSDSGKRKNR